MFPNRAVATWKESRKAALFGIQHFDIYFDCNNIRIALPVLGIGITGNTRLWWCAAPPAKDLARTSGFPRGKARDSLPRGFLLPGTRSTRACFRTGIPVFPASARYPETPPYRSSHRSSGTASSPARAMRRPAGTLRTTLCTRPPRSCTSSGSGSRRSSTDWMRRTSTRIRPWRCAFRLCLGNHVGEGMRRGGSVCYRYNSLRLPSVRTHEVDDRLQVFAEIPTRREMRGEQSASDGEAPGMPAFLQHDAVE
jgi:hypothetical protein